MWLAATVLQLSGGLLWAAEPVQLSVTLLSIPAVGGWTEGRLVLKAGDRPWRGVVEVAGTAAKVQVQLAVGARGQRVLSLPWWVAPGAGAPQVWVDGVPTNVVVSLPRAERRPRVLVGEAASLPVTPLNTAADPSESRRVPLAAWPETWRAYDAFDLVILPAGLERALRLEQEAALEHWMRWGGAVGTLKDDRTAVLRPLGAGAGIVAQSPDALQTAYVGWAKNHSSAGRPLMHVWERMRPWSGKTTWRAYWPGASLMIALVVYVVCLGAAAIVFASHPPLRRFGVRFLLVSIAGATLGIGVVAHGAGSAVLDVDEVTLLLDRGAGEGTHASAVVRARADQRATLPFVPLFQRPALTEAEPSKGRTSPHRAIRWDVDGSVWERSWVVGETAAIRVDGIGPDLGIRVRSAGEGAWHIANQGRSTLRAVGVLLPAGGFLSLADLPPGGQVRLDAAQLRGGTAGTEMRATGFWDALLMTSDAGIRREPMLVATLDPPISSMRFLNGKVRRTAESYLVLPLSGGVGS